jgi:hypothetical protein
VARAISVSPSPRYEARDTQYLLGLLVDEGIASPTAPGVTGMELAFLRKRIRLPDDRVDAHAQRALRLSGFRAAAAERRSD